MMLAPVLDTGRQTQLAVHKGPVTRQGTVCRYRTVRRLRARAHAALVFLGHGA